MCGIFSYFGKEIISQQFHSSLINGLEQLHKRGPDDKKAISGSYFFLGFQRLSLMDLSNDGMQPFIFTQPDSTIYIMCNGEIYNFTHILEKYNFQTQSHSDCEIIGHLFLIGGIDLVLEEISGEFACIITQVYHDGSYQYRVLRDPLGVRPLFIGHGISGVFYASEIKAITTLADKISPYTPGSYTHYNSQTDTISEISYFSYSIPTLSIQEEEALVTIRSTLTQCVEERLQSDRPLCCLLSGGLDSSLIAAIAQSHSTTPIHTFSIGLPGATDLPFAQQVADHIGSHHHVVMLSTEQGLQAIDETIFAIESYDITTVRASVWQFLIAKYISEETNFKAILCGEVSDELCSGYKYFHNAPDGELMHEENIRLLQDIHLYDGLRTDRTMAHHGLEVRLAFADPKFVSYILSLPYEWRMPHEGREKYLLRKAFDGTGLLPAEVLRRSKEAFSDGVSGKEKSRFEHIQDYIDTLISDEEYKQESPKFTHCAPISKESYYYRKKFVEYFGDQHSNVIPYFWMPKWSGEVQDPSARILSVYS